jgi:hypothetical protein
MARRMVGREGDMSVIRRGALALAAASFATIGLAPSASATTPTTGTGGFVLAAPPVTISSRSADGNTLVTLVAVVKDTGVLTGSDIDTITYVFHPDGTVTFTAATAYTGMVDGRSGTISLQFEGTGDWVSFQGQMLTVSYQGQLQTLSGTGTGGLATLHGQGTFQGSDLTGTGTYVFQYHFDP